ncbi:MAG TPA: TonB-dependent siderophore receptor [Methylophilaceae bacterium]|nr:TonB-dependent siderophore receptor [Methylophilaceae bacterium]
MKPFKSNPLYFAVLMALSSMPMNSHAGQSGTSKETGEETLPEVNVSAPEIDQEQGYNPPKASSSKFTAPLIDTPKSVTVVPQEVIKDTGSVTLQEALRTVPGITFGSAEGGGSLGDRPFIRGFDSQASMYVDGVRDVGGQTREIFALESVEVIKGPSGAYDGRGSAGGSINMVTKQPKAVNFVSGSVGLGTDRFKRATIDGNYRLADEVAVRVNVMAHKADTPGRDEVEVERFGLAPSITFGLTTPTSLNLSYYHLNTDDVPDYGLPYTSTGATSDARAANRLANGDRPVSVDKDNFYGLLDRDFRKTSADIGTATVKHAFSDTTVLRNTTRYGVTINDYIVTNPDDNKGNVQNGSVYRATKSRNTRTETIANITDLSLKFETGQFKHSLNTGIEFIHEESVNRPYNVTFLSTACPAGFATFDCTSLYDPNPHDPWTGSVTKVPERDTTRVMTKSAFAFDSIELSERWLLNLGLRFDDYKTDLDKETNSVRSPGGKFSNDKSFWNYQAGLVYKLQPNASIYASYGTSSTPSGISGGNAADGLSSAIENLEPERSKSYELGTKWDVLENLSLTAAVFKIEKTNARITLADGTTGVAGDQEVKGFEIGAAGRVTRKWQIFAGYTYLDSELVDNGGAGVNAGSDNGNQFPNTPENSASLWTTYDFLPKLTIGGGAFYVDKQFGNTANSVSIPSYVRYDAMAGYQIDKHLSLQLNIQNLTDKRYFDAAYSNHYATVAAGRLSYLTLNFTY